jgi:hypothetical protein
MRQSVVVFLALFLVVGALLQPRVSGAEARSHVSADAGKKVCKTVKKKGKRTKVCKTVKPRPSATPRPTLTATPLPAGNLAQRLADELSAASSDNGRYNALLDVFRSIHIGVYNGQTGKPIVRGWETNKNDIYFYDAEIQELATSLGRKQTYTFSDVATLLTSLGISVDSATVAGLEHALVAWALQHTDQPPALIPLLIRDLGLKHDTGYDLATVDHPEGVILDPLQTELVAIQLLAPIGHAAGQSSATRRFQSHMRPHYGICTVIKAALNPLSPDTYLPDSLQINSIVDGYFSNVIPSAIAVFVKQLASFNDKWGEKLGLAGTIASALHGLLLAYGLKVESGPTGGQLATHYGPPGHDVDAGKKLQFQARVVMQDKIPDWLQSCLHDAGFDVPDQGPVPGVEISWDEGGFFGIGANHLDDYGTVDQSPADGKTSDGTSTPKGVETMTFTPKTEPVPGMGQVKTVAGGVAPRALWGFAFTNPAGSISQLLFPMEGPELDWSVSYHKPRGFKFSNLKVHFDDYDESHNFIGSLDATYSASACGDNPYTDTWTSNASATATLANGKTNTVTAPGGGTGSHFLDTPVNIPPLSEIWHLNTDVPAHPTITLTISLGSQFTPATVTASAPLEENMDCPDNSGS